MVSKEGFILVDIEIRNDYLMLGGQILMEGKKK